jgi:pyruvate, orthophosphate dikinase
VAHDKSFGQFSFFFVVNGSNGHHGDGGMHGDNLFKIGRVDVVSGGDDQVLLAVNHVLLGGISSAEEFSIFRQLVGQFKPLAAGAMIQNAAALHIAPRLVQDGASPWLEIPEIVRTACGYIAEVQQCETAIDEYVTAGNLERNPLRQLHNFLVAPLGKLAMAASQRPDGTAGIDCNQGGSAELVASLYRLGFRRFSTPVARRDEIRQLLGQQDAGP